MAVINNDGKRERRRPSLKGGVMLDVVGGQERARAWPKKRPGKKHPHTAEQNEWFRQAQWATKYMAPEMYWQAQQAVQGTPLLPRDILTMMMAGRLAAFVSPTGRVIWSKAVQNDVSRALDVISDVPGAMLVRGPDGWQAILPGAPGQALVMPAEGDVPEWGEGGGGAGGPLGGGGADGSPQADAPLLADFPVIVNSASIEYAQRDYGVRIYQTTGLGFATRGFFQPAPLGPFNIYARLDTRLSQRGNNCRVGIGVRNSGTGRLATFGYFTANAGMVRPSILIWNNPDSYAGEYTDDIWLAADIPWLRLEYDGAIFRLYWGDGIDWVLYGSLSQDAWLGAFDQVGFLHQVNGKSVLKLLAWQYEDPALTV